MVKNKGQSAVYRLCHCFVHQILYTIIIFFHFIKSQCMIDLIYFCSSMLLS